MKTQDARMGVGVGRCLSLHLNHTILEPCRDAELLHLHVEDDLRQRSLVDLQVISDGQAVETQESSKGSGDYG